MILILIMNRQKYDVQQSGAIVADQKPNSSIKYKEELGFFIYDTFLLTVINCLLTITLYFSV
ncbi:hypothetical protein P4K66_00425 [Bacillus anthracis]|uniref:hypothetical protein n=1 Tax=Bacillus anthracis TaxID=1392 RepID=UPI002DBCCC1E|nr:hypothetical protein [Bacillus anthracis]MEC0014963.1 hypothetical protein [Bacillus anthracis]